VGHRLQRSAFFTRDVRGWATVGYTRDMGRRLVSVDGYYDRYHYSGLYPFGPLYDDGAFADAMGGDATVRWRAGRHAFTTGVEQRSNLRQDQWYGLGASREIDDHRTSQEVAVFGQDEIALTSRLTAVLGARYDWWSLKGGTGRPRLGLVYRTADDTAIKALYGEAYRAPNLYELYYTSAQITAAPNLEPELARTMELVFERRLGRHVRATATGYYTRSSNLIDPEFSTTNTSLREQGVGALERRRVRGRVALVVGRAGARQPGGSAAIGIETERALSNAPGSSRTIHVARPSGGGSWSRRRIDLHVGAHTVGGDLLPSFWLSQPHADLPAGADAADRSAPRSTTPSTRSYADPSAWSSARRPSAGRPDRGAARHRQVLTRVYVEADLQVRLPQAHL
jgi:hypothetical protein